MFFRKTIKKIIAAAMLLVIGTSLLSVAFSYRLAGSAHAAELPVAQGGLLIDFRDTAQTISNGMASDVHTIITLINDGDLPENRAAVFVDGTYYGICTADAAADALQKAETAFIMQNYGSEADKSLKPDGMRLGGGKRPDEDNGSMPLIPSAPVAGSDPPALIDNRFPPYNLPPTSAAATSADICTPVDGFISLPSTA